MPWGGGPGLRVCAFGAGRLACWLPQQSSLRATRALEPAGRIRPPQRDGQAASRQGRQGWQERRQGRRQRRRRKGRRQQGRPQARAAPRQEARARWRRRQALQEQAAGGRPAVQAAARCRSAQGHQEGASDKVGADAGRGRGAAEGPIPDRPGAYGVGIHASAPCRRAPCRHACGPADKPALLPAGRTSRRPSRRGPCG